MTTTVAQLSTLALDVWRFGLTVRGAHLFVVVRRLERELAATFDPSSVSEACRELCRAGYADKSPLGYRAKKDVQGDLWDPAWTPRERRDKR